MSLEPTAASPCPVAAALAVALTVAAGLAFLPAVLNDGDTFLHIRAGAAMLDARAVLTVDPFSATKAGQPWQTHEWLAQVVFGLAYRGGGLAGVLLLTALAGGVAVYQMTRAVGRHIEPVYAVLAVVLGVALAAPSLLARPHVLVLPFLTTILIEALDAAEDGRAPRWWLIAPVLWLWANMHGSFIIGLALLGLGGLEALLTSFGRAGWRGALGTALRWTPAAIVALIAVIAGPHGVDTLLFPLIHSASPALARVGEWRPLVISEPNTFAPVAAILLLVLSRGVVVAPLRMLAVIGLMALAIAHVRHLLLIGFIAPVLLAPALGQLRPAGAAKPARPIALVLAGLVAAGLVATRVALAPQPHDTPTTPVTALAALPAELRGRPVFNDYAFGAYLTFADIPPVIDSRVELYGTAAIRAYGNAITGRCRLLAMLAETDAAWTILAPDNPAVAVLDRLPGWTRIYSDGFAILHRRADPPAPAPTDCGAPP